MPVLDASLKTSIATFHAPITTSLLTKLHTACNNSEYVGNISHFPVNYGGKKTLTKKSSIILPMVFSSGPATITYGEIHVDSNTIKGS